MRRAWPYLLLVAVWLALLSSPREAPPDPLPDGTEQLDLYLRPKSLVQLRRAIARARRLGKRDAASSVWVKAQLVAGGRRFPCRLRLRGDFENHWEGPKVSLRVRIRGEELYRGARELNLIVAYDRAYFLEMACAWWNRALGLVPCASRLVWVRLNGKDQGVYALVEELSKEQLEREGYPFAPVFKADSAHYPKGIYVENRRLLYSRAYYHSKLGKAPNQPQVARLLEEVLRIYRAHPRFGPAQVRQLSHLLDLDAWARFSAVCRLLGSHPEHPHNATLYFDAASGLFEPILLDPEGYEPRDPQAFEASIHPLVMTRELLTERAFRDLRDRHLRQVLRRLPAFLAAYDGYGRYLPLLDRDPTLLLPDRTSRDPSLEQLVGVCVAYLKYFQAAGERIEQVLAMPDRPLAPPPLENQVSRFAHAVPRVRAGGADVTLRQGEDQAVVRLAELRVHGPGADEVTLAGGPAPEDGYRLRTWRLDRVLPPRADVVLRLDGFDPARHRVEVAVTDEEGPVPSRVAFPSTDRGSHLAFLRRPLPELAAAVSDLRLERRGAAWVVPAGEYRVRGVVIVPRAERLILEAGARLRFAPGAALLSYAPLTVAGTAARPVVCEPLDPQRGWGLLGVLSTKAWTPGGPAERRSRVEHLVLRGARGATINGVTYTGGLTFLSSDADVVRACFVDVGGDDALNVKRGDVRISECLFLDSVSDAIDLDWCSGTVERVLVAGCGGDGVDLSGAAGLKISGNVILAARDKGVSVGEASRTLLRGNLLAGCAIGVASKDRSRTRSLDDTVAGCAEAFVAYRKKPIFGGGELAADRPRLLGCGRATRRDERSRVTLTGVREGAFDAPASLRADLSRAPRPTVDLLLRSLGRPELRAGWPWSALEAEGP